MKPLMVEIGIHEEGVFFRKRWRYRIIWTIENGRPLGQIQRRSPQSTSEKDYVDASGPPEMKTMLKIALGAAALVLPEPDDS